jgi:hypothetical protein
MAPPGDNPGSTSGPRSSSSCCRCPLGNSPCRRRRRWGRTVAVKSTGCCIPSPGVTGTGAWRSGSLRTRSSFLARRVRESPSPRARRRPAAAGVEPDNYPRTSLQTTWPRPPTAATATGPPVKLQVAPAVPKFGRTRPDGADEPAAHRHPHPPLTPESLHWSVRTQFRP